MNDNQTDSRNYAHLPDELLAKILDFAPITVKKMNSMFDMQDKPIKDGVESLRKLNKIATITSSDFSSSLIAVDGGIVLERMTGTDLLLAVAVGVEGLTEDKTKQWGEDKNQYYQWQTVLSHNEANARLGQGVMFLMEQSVLASADHEIRIMDGTHFTPILKINSMLSAKEEFAGEEYDQALRDFLKETYKKIIPDIPDIITSALNNDHIVAMAKYSSSRDILDAFLRKHGIKVDDKTFFSLALEENEYLIPHTVGQSAEERRKIWDELHISCNLEIPEQRELNEALKKAVRPLSTKGKQSSLYFTYYKPYQDGPAYRIELKESLAKDEKRLEKYLLSIKRQIIFPEIREPFPQFLADLMAKGVADGMFALEESVKLSPDLKIDKGRFNLVFNYRTK